MNLTLLIVYLAFAATLCRALLVQAQLAAPTCAECSRPLERKELGEAVCRCGR